MIRLNDILDRVAQYNPGADLDLIKKAYVYSAKVHQGQVRKSGEPYLIHPLEVAGILTELRLDESTVCTGLLHDTIEDTLATREELDEIFGQEIGFLVDGVTKLSQLTFATKEEQAAENFRKMVVAMAEDIRVILVKLANRLHNMRTMEAMSAEKAERIASETLDIYAPLANRLGIAWVKSELEDLSFRYLKPHEYFELEEKISKKRKERENFVTDVVRIVQDKLRAQPGLETVEVTGRPKHLYSVYRKMRRKHVDIDQIHNLVAFRVITDDVQQCYAALGIIHANWRPIPGNFADYIAMPKPNMYQSLHTMVLGPYNEKVEFQIRTREMHHVAELGIAAHWKYKEGGGGARGQGGGKGKAWSKGEQQFAWLRQFMEWQRDLKDPTEFMNTVKVDLFAEEVFVFTPKGAVKALPRGSTPVDFAYAVHTEVGNRCTGARVNGKMVPLPHKLRNGDMVEVITSAHGKPSRDWLKFCKSSRAKAKIRAVVKLEERARAMELGRELLDRELRKHGRTLQRESKGEELLKVASDYGHKGIDDLVCAVGFFKLTPQAIAKRLLPPTELSGPLPAPQEEKEGVLSKLLRRVTPQQKTGITVAGMDDILVRYAKCCSPLPGESIAGFVSTGRGVTVHSSECSKALEQPPERRVQVRWDGVVRVPRQVSLKVVTEDRPGMLGAMTQALGQMGINIESADCSTENGRGVNLFRVGVTDNAQLKAVITQLERVAGVHAVSRVRVRVRAAD